MAELDAIAIGSHNSTQERSQNDSFQGHELFRWQDGEGTFEYVEEKWLRGFTKYNWTTR